MERPSPAAISGDGSGPAPRPRIARTALERRGRRLGALSQVFHGGTAALAVGIVAVFAGIVVALGQAAWPSIVRSGIPFLGGQRWDPVHNVYGALPFVAGTLVTSALGLALAVPVALGVAVFLSELAPRRLRLALATVVDLLAAVPSVVFGFWALIVLVPLMAGTVEPALRSLSGGAGPFSGTPQGLDVFTAGIVLAIMILPTISAVSREAMQAVARGQRDAALSLGATRWEATRLAVLGPAAPGILGGVLLGLGRALGETIAVTLVIGNNNQVPTSLFAPGQSIASLLANDLTSASAQGPLQFAALFELGLVLLLVTLAVNVLARLLLWRLRQEPGGAHSRLRRRRGHAAGGTGPDGISAVAAAAVPSWRARARDRYDVRLRRRRLVFLIVAGLCTAATVVALLPLASLLETAIRLGGPAIVTPSFYTSTQAPPCTPGALSHCTLGGVGPQLLGTLILLGLGALVAMPLGILVGVYLAEYGRDRLGPYVSFVTDVMTGIPSILLGAFVLVVFLRAYPDAATSALAGGVALGLLMVPIVARTTEEALRAVPVALRESALALGFPRHRVTLRVAVGTARAGILTGALLASARAGGETAAILLTTGGFQYWPLGVTHPIGALPLVIFEAGQTNYANWQEEAWGATLLLLLLMLLVSLAARLLLRRAPAGE